MNQETQSTGGRVVIALTLIFTVLKLTKVIDWNWFFVLLPIILPIAVLVGAIIVGFATYGLSILFKGKK